MSTNSERIASNNTRLSALVETANALPDAGSGGGVETCDVTIDFPIERCFVTRYVNGSIVGEYYTEFDAPSSITDVVIGSILTVCGGEVGVSVANTEFLDARTYITDQQTPLRIYSFTVTG